MSLTRLLLLAAVAMAPHAALAAEPLRCLTPEQRRAAVATHQAVPLARAMRAVQTRAAGEVLRARLCEQDKQLVYVLTVLARDGKVTRVAVDAASGALLNGR